MKLYHGSYIHIPTPRIIPQIRLLDFGFGFYATTDKEQAVKFTKKFTNLGKSRVINIYDYDEINSKNTLTVHKFNAASTEWLHYVVANRSGTGKDNDFDIVIGPVANDRVYEVVENFELGDYSEDEAIRRLLSFRLTDQIVFKTEESLLYLSYLSHEFIAE